MNTNNLVGMYGELLARRYLKERGLAFDYEPVLPNGKKVDFVLTRYTPQPIRIEVKTIWAPPPTTGVSTYDPYEPIRAHIEEGKRKFSRLEGGINIIALASFPGSFADIYTPRIMLGAMNGNYGFQIPVDLARGLADSSRMQATFLPGQGLMVRETGPHRNTRVSALMTLHNPDRYSPDIPPEGMSEGEAMRRIVDHMSESDLPSPYVTVWDSAVAPPETRVPLGLFSGPMDAHLTHDGEAHVRTFCGELRALKDS